MSIDRRWENASRFALGLHSTGEIQELYAYGDYRQANQLHFFVVVSDDRYKKHLAMTIQGEPFDSALMRQLTGLAALDAQNHIAALADLADAQLHILPSDWRDRQPELTGRHRLSFGLMAENARSFDPTMGDFGDIYLYRLEARSVLDRINGLIVAYGDDLVKNEQDYLAILNEWQAMQLYFRDDRAIEFWNKLTDLRRLIARVENDLTR